MSTIAIPTVRVSVRDIYENIPRSIKIQMECALQHTELENIEMSDREDGCINQPFREYICRHTEPLANIINVFNDNVNYANTEIGKFIPFEKRTIEQYTSEHPNCTPEDYGRDESLRKSEFEEMNYERAELYQLGGILRTLGEKIMRVAEILSSKDRVDSTIPLLPVLACIQPDVEYLPSYFNFKCLRKVETLKAPLVVQEPVTESPAILAIETIYAPAPDAPIIDVLVLAAPKIDVAVLRSLGSGQTLAICCDPTWEKQPVAFTPSEKGWAGQVPVNKLWKFVILENEKVKSWEQGKNRYCNDRTQAFTVKANEVKF